jgi:hypothetical protein
VRRDLGVGLGGEPVAGVLEVRTQFGEVLDDSVVHECDPLRGADVRVGVGVVGRTVRRPARVADADGRLGQRLVADRLLEVPELAGPLLGGQRPVCGQGDAGGVVAAVLEATQALDDHTLGAPVTHVTHDPAHGCHCIDAPLQQSRPCLPTAG